VNFLGKIFTVMILVMSVMFMAFSVMVYATHRNWKVRAAELTIELAAQTSKNDSLEREQNRIHETLAREQAARKTHVAVLATAELAAKTTLKDVTDDNTQLNQRLSQDFLDHDRNVKGMEQLTQEVGLLRETLVRALDDRDAKYAEAVDAIDRFLALQTQYENLTLRHEQLAADASRMQLVLEINGIKATDDIAGIPPKVNGEVLASSNEFIEISLGSDDGLKTGHHIEVYRGTLYLGRAVIRHTSDDRAVAQILVEFRKGVIKKGDRFATKLS
jgi:DNA-binding phage protein